MKTYFRNASGYRPHTKVMFSQASVILFVGGVHPSHKAVGGAGEYEDRWIRRWGWIWKRGEYGGMNRRGVNMDGGEYGGGWIWRGMNMGRVEDGFNHRPQTSVEICARRQMVNKWDLKISYGIQSASWTIISNLMLCEIPQVLQRRTLCRIRIRIDLYKKLEVTIGGVIKAKIQ